ncbi:MAG: putative ABC transporter permease [Clostridiales bacterium]|nr:putative ABC transporter permease [Clostridiales bacterium]
MDYTYTELVTFLLLYGFLGWLIEVIVVVVKDRTFSNRGFFDLPICPKYGIMAVALMVALPTLEGHVITQYILSLVVVSVVDFLAGDLTRRTWRRKLSQYERATLFSGEWQGLLMAMGKALTAMLVILLLHPFLYTFVSLLPVLLLRIVDGVILGIMAFDLVGVLYAVSKSRNGADLAHAEEVQQSEQSAVQGKLGNLICRNVWRRLNRAYPDMEGRHGRDAGDYVFAKGVCLDKLFWVFIICAFLGDLIETVFCRFSAGFWMSRSSVLYGAFSVVWGIGAVVLTMVLQPLAGKEDRYVFLGGAVVGGVYEYMCSVFTEYVFGTVFWDYSDMPFNINGRTNLLFCIFWGLLAVVWIKVLYPAISGWIEHLPTLYAKVVTWALVLLMVADALLTGAVMLRYVERSYDLEAGTVLEEFIDNNYSDEFVEERWPNMKLT